MPLQTTGLRWVNEGLASFIGGIKSAVNATSGFMATARSSTSSLLGFGTISRNLAADLEYLARRVLLLTAAYAGVAAVKDFIKTGFEQIVLYDRLSKSIQSLIARDLINTKATNDFGEAMRMAAPEAAALLDRIVKLAIVSTFESEDIIRVQQFAQSVGIAKDQAEIMTSALAAWGTVTQKQPEVLNNVTNALTDMFTKGRVQSQEMRQLALNGIPAWNYLADALGVTVEQLRQMVTDGLVPANVGIKAIIDGISREYGPLLKEFAFSWAGLTSSLQDLKKIGLREFFTATFAAIQPALERFVSVLLQPETMATIRSWGEGLGQTAARFIGFAEAVFASGDPIGFLAVAISRVIPGFYTLYEAVGRMAATFAQLAGAAFGWGENIGMSFANGIITAATYIVEALTYIGGIIASWLAPGSPPKLLPDLPAWGEQAAQEWFKGWTKADASALKDIVGTIKDALENAVSGGTLPQEGLIPLLMGGKDALAKAINEISHFGEVTTDTLSDIHAWTGRAGPDIRGIVDTFLDWQEASILVKEAQEELTRVNEYFEEQIRRVKDAYDEQLRPLNERMRGLKKEENQIRDNQRIAKLEETIRDDESTDEEKRLAQLEIEEIKLRQQQDAIEEKRDAEVSALEETQKKEVSLAEERLAAAKADEESAKAAYESKQAQIGLQQEHNSLIAEQSKLLDTIAKQQAAAAGGGIGGAKGGGGARGGKIKAPPIPSGPLDLGKDILTDIQDSLDAFNQKAQEAKKYWDDLKLSFQNAKKDAKETADALKPLEPLAFGIAFAFGVVAAGALLSFAAGAIAAVAPFLILVRIGALLKIAWDKDFLGIQERAGELWATVQTTFGNIKTYVQETLIPAIGEVGKAFERGGVTEALKETATQVYLLTGIDINPFLATMKRVASDIGTAWNTTFLPALQAVYDFFVNRVKPVVVEIATAVLPLLLVAAELAALVFNNILVPALHLLWTVFTTLVWPVIEKVAEVLSETLLPALTVVAQFIAEQVLPVIGTFFDFVSVHVVPLIESLAKVLKEVLRLAFEAVTTVVTDVVIPGLKKLWEDYIKPIISALSGPGGLSAAIDGAKLAFGFIATKVDTFITSLGGLGGIIDSVKGWLDGLAEKLNKIHVPDILIGHSPSPFEKSLGGIAEAAADLGGAFSDDLTPPTNDLSSAFDTTDEQVVDLIGGFDTLTDSVHGLVQGVKDLKKELETLEIPEDLTPGSPTPFELGIRGITDAIGALTAAVNIAPTAFAGLSGMTEELWGKFNDVQKKARELIDDLQQMVLKGSIGGLGQMIDNLKTIRGLWDGIQKAVDDAASASLRSADAMSKIKDLDKTIFDLQNELAGKETKKVEETREQRIQRELAEALAKREEEQQKLIQAETERADAEVRRQQLQVVADRAQQELEDARAAYHEMSLTDPENAKELFDLKSKQIKDLADLDNQIINAKDERERQSLIDQRAFLADMQQNELELFQHQAQRRVDAWKEQIQEIAQAWQEIWDQPSVFVGENVTEDQAKAIQNLYNMIVLLSGIQLPTWLQPGSPTPLELGLRGISSAMRQMALEAIPMVRAQFQLIAQPASANQIGGMAAAQSYAYTYSPNFNLGVTTNQSPAAVYQSYEIMQSLYARRGR